MNDTDNAPPAARIELTGLRIAVWAYAAAVNIAALGVFLLGMLLPWIIQHWQRENFPPETPLPPLPALAAWLFSSSGWVLLLLPLCCIVAFRLSRRETLTPARALAFAAISTAMIVLLAVFVSFVSCLPFLRIKTSSGAAPMTLEVKYRNAVAELTKAKTREERFYALGEAAKQSFNAGKTEDAKKYSNELLAMAPEYPKDWNYGNAIHDANMVLGRIAVKEGRIDDAKELLISAGKTPGSPQLDSFGPNVSLAKDLLNAGERDAVIQYFELCRNFWKLERGKLDKWIGATERGEIPDFGANLLY
jgi:hypothetical protein